MTPSTIAPAVRAPARSEPQPKQLRQVNAAQGPVKLLDRESLPTGWCLPDHVRVPIVAAPWRRHCICLIGEEMLCKDTAFFQSAHYPTLPTRKPIWIGVQDMNLRIIVGAAVSGIAPAGGDIAMGAALALLWAGIIWAIGLAY